MVLYLVVNLLLLQQLLAITYRFQPPNVKLALGEHVFDQKPNQIRKKFRNQGDLESYEIAYCLKFDLEMGVCKQCYQGFLLQKGSCQIDTNFDFKKKEIQLDYIRSHSPALQQKQMNNIMLNRNPFCASTNTDGSLCLTCHKGHRLESGNCIENEDDFTLAEQLYLRPMQAPKHTFCRLFNQDGNCISCFPQADFDKDSDECIIRTQHRLDCRLHQLCVPESVQCLTYSSQGFCKTCPLEAININGVCRINKPQSLCAQLGKQGKCAKCTTFGQLKDGVCRFKSPHCLQYNLDGTCNVCTAMYRRVNGQCIRPSKVMFVSSDPYCATWKSGRCIQCKFGFGFYKQYCIDLQELKLAGHTADPDPIQVENIA